jgi:hypothetical protein
MADKNKFEEMLERLVNEDKAGAEELFHDIVVEKSRDIYASLIESDIEIEEDDTEVEETTDEEVDEATDEEVDEASDEEVDEATDEETNENFDLDEFEVEADPMDMGGDPTDDMMGDIEAGDDEGEEGEEEGDIEDRVVDLEDALDDLKSEFEKMMGDEEGEGDEEGDDEPEEEAFAFEATDEEVDEASDEEVDEASDEEVDEASDEEVEESAKSDREQMREYVDKVAGGHGAEKKSTGDNGDSGKSPVASANNMGGTSANILKGGEAGSGDHAGLGDLNAKDQDGGNINVPGGKASKAGKSEPGHGAEKKGKPEAADNKKSVVGK